MLDAETLNVQAHAVAAVAVARLNPGAFLRRTVVSMGDMSSMFQTPPTLCRIWQVTQPFLSRMRKVPALDLGLGALLGYSVLEDIVSVSDCCFEVSISVGVMSRRRALTKFGVHKWELLTCVDVGQGGYVLNYHEVVHDGVPQKLDAKDQPAHI